MDVTVHIERLVVEGVELGPGGADRLRTALAEALASALPADPGATPPAALTVHLPPAGPAGPLGPGATTALGRAVGRALGGSFGTAPSGGTP